MKYFGDDIKHKIYITPVPKNCAECPMYVSKGWGDLRDYCSLTYKDTWDADYETKRHPDCPLVTDINELIIDIDKDKE